MSVKHWRGVVFFIFQVIIKLTEKILLLNLNKIVKYLETSEKLFINR